MATVMHTTLGDFKLPENEDGPRLWPSEYYFGRCVNLCIRKKNDKELAGFSFDLHGACIYVQDHWSVDDLQGIFNKENAMLPLIKSLEDQEAWFEILFCEKIMTDSTVMPKLVKAWYAAGMEHGKMEKAFEFQRVLMILGPEKGTKPNHA